MLKVTFRNANSNAVIAGPVFLPDVPAQGESVSLREDPSDWREQVGVVTKRGWYIVSEQPDVSEVVLWIALEQKKR